MKSSTINLLLALIAAAWWVYTIFTHGPDRELIIWGTIYVANLISYNFNRRAGQ